MLRVRTQECEHSRSNMNSGVHDRLYYVCADCVDPLPLPSPPSVEP